MEAKHACVLEGLFWNFKDNIDDSEYNLKYYESAKKAGDLEHAQYFLNEAKTRIDKNETVKAKMENIIRKYPEIEDNPMKLFYDMKIDEYQELRAKIMKMSI